MTRSGPFLPDCRLACFLFVSLLSSPCFSQNLVSAKAAAVSEKESVPAVPGAEFTFSPLDAVYQAVADVQSKDIPEECRQFVRYVWIQNESPAKSRLVKFATQSAINRGSFLAPLPVVAGGHLVRLRLDLLAPRTNKDGKLADLENLIKLWERLGEADSNFYVVSESLKTVPEYTHTDGKRYNAKRVRVAMFSTHINPQVGAILQGLTRSAVPVVRYEHFVLTALSTLNGGLYYDFAGIRGQTFDDFAKAHGVSVKQFRDLRADRKAGLFCSDVTDKTRCVNEVNGPFGTFTWTEDIADETEDGVKNAIRTLLDAKFDASEAIAINARGLCDFALFDGKGALQDSVPDNIAVDFTLPTPGTTRLQPAASCVVCHAQSDGFRTLRNDVLAYISGRAVEGAFPQAFRPQVATITADERDRLLSGYQDDLKRLNTARLEYSGKVFLATDGGTVQDVGAELKSVRNLYGVGRVSPEQACLELGFLINEKDPAPAAAVKGKRIVKPDSPRMRIAKQVLQRYIPAEEGVEEDPFLMHLKNGGSVTRKDWKIVFPLAASRVADTLQIEQRHAAERAEILKSLSVAKKEAP